MAYIKTDWKDKVVEKPRTFTIQENPDGTVTLIPDEGTVYEVGTPVNAANMNKIEQGIEEVTTYTNEQLGKVSYYQTTEPADKTQGKTWFNPDTGQLYVANGTEYQPIPPVQILEEAADFTESGIYVSHENTVVENGSIRLYTSFIGTTATRPADNGSVLNTSNKLGIRIVPNKDLEGVKITISNNTTLVDRVYLYQGVNVLKIIEPINFLTKGNTVEIFYPFKSGVNYDILLGRSSSTWTAGYFSTPTFPYTSTDISITNGISNPNNPDANCYGILSVRASSPITSGNAIIHWKQKPSSIKAWDLATYQNTLNGETVNVDVLKNGTAGTTATRPADTSTEVTSVTRGLKISIAVGSATTLTGLSVKLSNNIINPKTLYLYTSDATPVLLRSVDITGKVAGDNVIITAPLRPAQAYYIVIDNGGVNYTIGQNTAVTYPFTSTYVNIIAGASYNGAYFTDYSGYAYNIVSVTGIGAETTFSNIPQNFDISTISPSQEIWLKVNISRVNTSSIPTCDYIARRYVR